MMIITTISRVPGILHMNTLNPPTVLKGLITIPHTAGEETEDPKGLTNLPGATWIMAIGCKLSD